MTQPLTPTLKKTLDFIAAYIKEHGYPPVLREIGRHPGPALRKVDELVARGYLKRSPGRRSRNIILMFEADAAPNWENVANALMLENNALRARMHVAGLKTPPKSMDY